MWKSITENCDWAEMGIASEAQKMPVWLQWPISLWSSAVRVMTVILLHRRCVMKTATRKLWFSISYRLYLWMKLYRCCLQWLWQTDNLSQRKSRIQWETCSLRVSESRRHRQTQLKIGFSKWIKLSYSEAGR